MPYSRWFRSELWTCSRTIWVRRISCTKLFRPEAVCWWRNTWRAGATTAAPWGLLNFMIWHGKHIR